MPNASIAIQPQGQTDRKCSVSSQKMALFASASFQDRHICMNSSNFPPSLKSQRRLHSDKLSRAASTPGLLPQKTNGALIVRAPKKLITRSIHFEKRLAIFPRLGNIRRKSTQTRCDIGAINIEKHDLKVYNYMRKAVLSIWIHFN